MTSNFHLKNLIIFIIAVLIGVLLGIGTISLVKKRVNYYAVFLNNGAVYFGKISTFPRLKLNDAIFFQSSEDGQVSLQRFKDAFWMPKGPIYLNRDSILFIAPLSENSPLINIIEQKQTQILQSQQSQQSQSQQTDTQPSENQIQQ